MEKMTLFNGAAALQGGDPMILSLPNQQLQWYPMRVTYNREMKVQASFLSFGIESFIPMRYEFVTDGDDCGRRLVPAVHNLIFVRSTKDIITKLKHSYEVFEPLRYIVSNSVTDGGFPKILTVRDRDMENFIRACRVGTDIEYLRYDPFLDKPGQRVRVINGKFAGVEGVVKRIRKNKRVVVMISGVTAVMLNSIPYTWLEKI